MIADGGLLAGVTGRTVATPRLETFVLEGGEAAGVPVLFVHGNVSSNRFGRRRWRRCRRVARDRAGSARLRSLGGAAVDATRGLRDFSDDLRGLVEGWTWGGSTSSAGRSRGNVVMQYAIDYPARWPRSCWSPPAPPTASGRGHHRDADLARLRRLGRRHRQPRVRAAAGRGRPQRRQSALAAQHDERVLFQTAISSPRTRGSLCGRDDRHRGRPRQLTRRDDPSENWPQIAPGPTA
jgi:hypothetical protein